MKLHEHQVAFPVVCVSNNGHVSARESWENLTVCGLAALRSGYFKRMEMFDARGTNWTVVDAGKIERVGRFWGFKLFYSRQVRIELDCRENSAVDLDSAKRKILDTHGKLPHQWDMIGGFSAIQEKVNSAKTFEDLASLLPKN